MYVTVSEFAWDSLYRSFVPVTVLLVLVCGRWWWSSYGFIEVFLCYFIFQSTCTSNCVFYSFHHDWTPTVAIRARENVAVVDDVFQFMLPLIILRRYAQTNTATITTTHIAVTMTCFTRTIATAADATITKRRMEGCILKGPSWKISNSQWMSCE